MTEKILLVDYENIQAVDLKALPADVTVRFVLGGKQGKLPTDLAVQAQQMGCRFQYVRVDSVERNACDFCIAFYLGEFLTQNPRAECAILSRDKKGFDPLVKHLIALGYNARRVSTQKDAFAAEPPTLDAFEFERLKSLLSKDKVPPLTRKSLNGKVKSWFPKLSQEHRAALTQQLFTDGLIEEADKRLKFKP